jgi:hypothetical protein
MGKVWVLDTETKGTGANMVPLEKVLRKPAPGSRHVSIAPKPKARATPGPAEAPAPREPRRFKVLDLLTRCVLADRASARATVDVLEGIRSIVDVNIYVWEPKTESWRQLLHGEKQVLWGFRGQ